MSAVPSRRTGFGTAWLVSLVIAPFTMALSGWTLSVIWGWFVTPIFGLPRLSVLQAIGLGLVASYLTKDVPTPASDSDPLAVVVSNVLVGIYRAVMLLAFGGVVYLLMGGAA